MALFRDVRDVRFDGNIIGCSNQVSLECGGDEIEHSTCDEDAISYRGVTGLFYETTIENVGSTLKREVADVTYDGNVLEHATTFEIAETAEELVDDSDGHAWTTFVGVTKRSVEARATWRDLLDLDFGMGEQGALAADYLAADPTSDGFPGAASTVSADGDMMVTACNSTCTHAELGEASAEWKGTNSTKTFTAPGTSFASIHVGDVGTVSFECPSADGGIAIVSVIVNGVVLEKRLTLNHGEMLRETLRVKHFSTSGDVSPLS